jgi:hypothetical protein
MTIGQLFECLVGKAAALQGMDADGTAFEEHDIEHAKDVLEKLGYERNGFEYLYNGMTGEKMLHQIFIGPTFYQRLKHLVEDKIHCLSMDHEVLTADGWKNFHQLTLDDKVATLEYEEFLVYKNPTKLLYYPDYNGKMYHVKTDEVDLFVTPEHRMWVANNETFDFETVESISGQSRKYKKDVTCVINNSKYSGPYEPKIDYSQVTCLPDWVWKLDSIQAKGILECLIKYTWHDGMMLITKSEQLADDVMRLALHCGSGWSASKHKFGEEMWRIKVKRYDRNPMVSHDYRVIEDYNSPVFCLEVPSEVFYVRRNGLAVWTGNSRSRGPKTSLTRQANCCLSHIKIYG